MKDIIIDGFRNLHVAVQAWSRDVVIYRGVRSVEYELNPKIGRYKLLHTDDRRSEELRILRLFKEQSIPYLDVVPTSDWDWLAIGQHHGLPTRLLDWTRNPLVAAYFAVENAHDEDSVIYAFHSNKYINTEKHKDPYDVSKVGRFIPRHVTQRITAQTGLFTIHPEPEADFRKDKRIQRLIIRQKIRKNLKDTLYKYGVHRASLFPSLDGLSRHIEWLRTDVY
ncbi:FRG domain-containing protein [bacterium]|nr:FRG domain-containing protein [bacterium]